MRLVGFTIEISLQYNILCPINTFGYLTRQRLFSTNHYSWWGAVVPHRTQISAPYILERNFVKFRTGDRLWDARSLSFNKCWWLRQRGYKWPGREAIHLPLSSAEIQIELSWSIPLLSYLLSYHALGQLYLYLYCVLYDISFEEFVFFNFGVN